MDSNGTAVPTKPLPELRRERRTLQEQIRISQLKRTAKVLESLEIPNWTSPYLDLWDRWRGGWTVLGPYGSHYDRRHGMNFPIFRTEAELSLLRTPARILVSTNTYASGLLSGLTAFVIGTGFTYTAEPRVDGVRKEFLQRIQDIFDEFIDSVQWESLEAELFWRDREDGEFLLHLGMGDDGRTWVRTIEPEQLTQPPGTAFEEWGFGILTPRHDIQNHQKYYIVYGENIDEGEELTPADIVHKRANVKRSIKRGLTDFCFSTYDAFQDLEGLRNAMAKGAKFQAAVAGVREHEGYSAAQVASFQAGLVDFRQTDPVTGRQTTTQKVEPGSVLDMPVGVKWQPSPSAQNADAHVAILDAIARGAATKWNAPEWLVSANAANMGAYTASLVAESPFVINVKRRQREYRHAFLKVFNTVLYHAIQAGRLPANTMDAVYVKAEPPSIEHRNKLEEAQTNQIYVMLRAKSPREVAIELGLDYDEQLDYMQEDQERLGTGLGQQLQMPDQGQGQGMGAGPPRLLGEWMTEAKKDVSGHCHDESGHWVSCDAPGAVTSEKPKPSNLVQPKIIFRKHPFAQQIETKEIFNTPEKAADWTNKNFGDWSKKLSDQEIEGIATYAGGRFSNINDGLRGKESLDQTDKDTIKTMDSIMAKSSLPESVTVFRGIKDISFLGNGPKSLIGKTISEDGFTSTTLMQKVANGFASGGGLSEDARLEISLPKGSKAISVDAALGANALHQHELVLPRGSQFKITGFERKPISVAGRVLKSFYIFKAELV